MSDKPVVSTIVLDIGGKEIPLSLTQAEELYVALEKLFGEKIRVVKGPARRVVWPFPQFQYTPRIDTPMESPPKEFKVWCNAKYSPESRTATLSLK